jgi:hypothetical protein
MADTENGGLSSIDPTASFAQQLQTQTSESQKVLDEHRKRLMNLISSRKQMPFDPSLMALAAGLLSPTKTGSFGESLSYGMTGYSAEAEKQFRREQEEAKLAYELELAAQQQKRDLLGQQFMAGMLSEVPEAPVAPAAPAVKVPMAKAPPVAVAGEVPEAVPAAPAQAAEAAKGQTVEAAQVLNMPELALPAVPRNRIARMTDEQIALLKSFNPAMGKILEEYRKSFRENRDLQIKEVDLARRLQEFELSKRKDIREERKVRTEEQSVERNLPGVGTIKMPISFWGEVDTALKSGDVGNLIKLYKSNQLPINTTVDSDGKLRMMTPSEIELKNKKAEARFTQSPIKVQIPEYGTGVFEMAPVDYRDYLDAKAKKDPNALQHWFNGSQFSGFVVPGAKIGTQFNSPELTRPAPPPAPVEPPAAAPVEPAQRAPAPAPAAPVAQRAPAVPSAAPRRAPTPGKVLSAEELANIAAENELERQIRLNKAKEEESTAQTGTRERAKEEAKADVEFGFNMMKAGNDAPNLRIIAKDLRSIATSNTKILDIMQDTTITDALARTVQTGLQTPWGSISIDPKDLYTAINNYSASKPGITKKDRDAYSLLLRNIAQLTVLERRLSRGEGQISDRETVLFQQVNLLPSDSALAVRLKSELMEERANVTEKIGDAFYKYKKKTGGSYEDFTHSDEYKDIRTNYESKLDRIRDANARLLSNTPAPSAPQTALPPEAAKQLKQGEVTTFKNGQSWTIRDGKPVRVK